MKEQVQSLGAKFLEIDLGESGAGAGGYAKELSEDAHRKEVELLAKAARENDIIITTAAIPGRRAPVLITKEMIPTMKPGSVIVDLAAETGGNAELTEAGKTIVVHGVTIIGLLNIPSSMPLHASQMYSRNIASLLGLMLKKDGTFDLNIGDEVVKGTVITHGGQVVHEATQKIHGSPRRHELERSSVGAYIFALAIFVGNEVISKVPTTLHTPLMSGANAIHGIIIVGAMLVATAVPGPIGTILGFLGVVLGTINVVGGFVVTDRMLQMFRARPRPAKPPLAKSPEKNG